MKKLSLDDKVDDKMADRSDEDLPKTTQNETNETDSMSEDKISRKKSFEDSDGDDDVVVKKKRRQILSAISQFIGLIGITINRTPNGIKSVPAITKV